MLMHLWTCRPSCVGSQRCDASLLDPVPDRLLPHCRIPGLSYAEACCLQGADFDDQNSCKPNWLLANLHQLPRERCVLQCALCNKGPVKMPADTEWAPALSHLELLAHHICLDCRIPSSVATVGLFSEALEGRGQHCLEYCSWESPAGVLECCKRGGGPFQTIQTWSGSAIRWGLVMPSNGS